MKSLYKIVFLVLITAISASALAACNTVEGFGEDTRVLGEAISGASKESRGY